MTGGGAALRRREATLDCATGNVTELRRVPRQRHGRDHQPRVPAQRQPAIRHRPGQPRRPALHLTYEYDPVVATHVTKVSDSFGLSSQASHDYRFGKVSPPPTPTPTRPRISRPLRPRRASPAPTNRARATATLAFAYAPIETPASDATGQTVPLTQVPWALTRHVDKDADGALKPSGTLDTLLFTDGLKRVVQTKKDASVWRRAPANPRTR